MLTVFLYPPDLSDGGTQGRFDGTRLLFHVHCDVFAPSHANRIHGDIFHPICISPFNRSYAVLAAGRTHAHAGYDRFSRVPTDHAAGLGAYGGAILVGDATTP